MLKKGQIVYCNPGINKSRYNKDIVEGIIEKVGRKYIHVSIGYHTYKFEKETLKPVASYPPDYYLHLDKQGVFDERERKELIAEFESFFSFTGKGKFLTLEQLRKIKEIIDS